MAHALTIRGGEIRLTVELDSGPTAEKLLSCLPFEARASLWGDEVYFRIPVSAGLEDGAHEVVEVGDVCYWPEGEAMCLFFGPTPASACDEPRAASAVTVLGKVTGGLEDIGRIASGETLIVEDAAG